MTKRSHLAPILNPLALVSLRSIFSALLVILILSQPKRQSFSRVDRHRQMTITRPADEIRLWKLTEAFFSVISVPKRNSISSKVSKRFALEMHSAYPRISGDRAAQSRGMWIPSASNPFCLYLPLWQSHPPNILRRNSRFSRFLRVKFFLNFFSSSQRPMRSKVERVTL